MNPRTALAVSYFLTVVSGVPARASASLADRLTDAITGDLIEGCRANTEGKALSVAIAVVDDRLALMGYRRMDGVRSP